MRIAIALFPDVEELDFAGPWEVLTHWALNVAATGSSVVTVASSLAPVRAAKGLRVLPDTTWTELGAIDVLVLPGGWGTRALMQDASMLELLRAYAAAGTLMTSVCTGSLVYAAAGLLHNRPATTYFSALELLGATDSTIDVRGADRFVDAGSVITSAGVSAGIDMALYLVQRLDSTEAARSVRRGIQYDPEPPI
jgi:transcriptional regulator GlxA family with amidase domain